MGGGEEFECITETSALQTKKKITKVISMTLQILIISSVYPLKPDLHTASSLTSITATKKGKKKGNVQKGI